MQARSLTGHQHYTFFKSVTPNFEFSFFVCRLSSCCAAGYAESNASFRHRANLIQLTDDHNQALNDIRCFNHMGLSVNGQPGQLDPEKSFRILVDVVCPRSASMRVQASLKQLAYEALTVAVAAIKQCVETLDESSKKLPPQEKDQRLRN